MKSKPYDPVFPVPVGPMYCPGLTMRELFAAMVMQGLSGNSIPGSHHEVEEMAREAVVRADALIRKLGESAVGEAEE